MMTRLQPKDVEMESDSLVTRGQKKKKKKMSGFFFFFFISRNQAPLPQTEVFQRNCPS